MKQKRKLVWTLLSVIFIAVLVGILELLLHSTVTVNIIVTEILALTGVFFLVLYLFRLSDYLVNRICGPETKPIMETTYEEAANRYRKKIRVFVNGGTDKNEAENRMTETIYDLEMLMGIAVCYQSSDLINIHGWPFLELETAYVQVLFLIDGDYGYHDMYAEADEVYGFDKRTTIQLRKDGQPVHHSEKLPELIADLHNRAKEAAEKGE